MLYLLTFYTVPCYLCVLSPFNLTTEKTMPVVGRGTKEGDNQLVTPICWKDAGYVAFP